jgi:hypothetical protein
MRKNLFAIAMLALFPFGGHYVRNGLSAVNLFLQASDDIDFSNQRYGLILSALSLASFVVPLISAYITTKTWPGLKNLLVIFPCLVFVGQAVNTIGIDSNSIIIAVMGGMIMGAGTGCCVMLQRAIVTDLFRNTGCAFALGVCVGAANAAKTLAKVSMAFFAEWSHGDYLLTLSSELIPCMLSIAVGTWYASSLREDDPLVTGGMGIADDDDVHTELSPLHHNNNSGGNGVHRVQEGGGGEGAHLEEGKNVYLRTYFGEGRGIIDASPAPFVPMGVGNYSNGSSRGSRSSSRGMQQPHLVRAHSLGQSQGTAALAAAALPDGTATHSGDGGNYNPSGGGEAASVTTTKYESIGRPATGDDHSDGDGNSSSGGGGEKGWFGICALVVIVMVHSCCINSFHLVNQFGPPILQHKQQAMSPLTAAVMASTTTVLPIIGAPITGMYLDKNFGAAILPVVTLLSAFASVVFYLLLFPNDLPLEPLLFAVSFGEAVMPTAIMVLVPFYVFRGGGREAPNLGGHIGHGGDSATLIYFQKVFALLSVGDACVSVVGSTLIGYMLDHEEEGGNGATAIFYLSITATVLTLGLLIGERM